jgi:hypothetical protein
MAETKQNRTIPFFRTRSLVLGGVFVASSVVVIGFSQSGLATGSDPESCDPGDRYAKVHDHYSRARFTAATAVLSQDKNGLFWNSLSKNWMTTEQMELLQLAYEIGFEDGGHQHAELVQAILMQETIAGQLGRMGHMTAPVGKRSYGVMQVKVTAARDVLNKYSEFGQFRADEELIVALLSDDEFNIRIASKFLLQLGGRGRAMERSLVAYNIGLTASRAVDDPHSFKYVLGARSYLDEVVRPFNHRFGDASLRVASANPGLPDS